MSETKVKTPKWDKDAVTTLTEGYRPEDSNASVAELMEVLNRTKRQVIGKLVHLKAYKAPEKVKTEKKDEGPTKKEILREIDASGFDTKGFEGATKDALKRLQVEVASKTSEMLSA